MRCCPSTKNPMRKRDCSANKWRNGESRSVSVLLFYAGENPVDHLSNGTPVAWRKVMGEDLNSHMTFSVLRDVGIGYVVRFI